MPIDAGRRIASYEILAAIGAGGMGEVYRARDTKLNRDVAIKVLPEGVAGDPEHLARFEREAQLLAALNHPHIAHIHGLEESNGIRALVMELVEGPTLQERLEAHKADGRGLPLGEALTIARQIAEALEGAHEKGIIHRDLKPANIKITPEGIVKILDFGLAKASDTASASSAALTNSPTLSMRATQAGLILGTAAYMSPEQAAGQAVDKRSDIWAFGVVLWEMLTGVALFAGDTISHTLAFVITREPDWSRLPANTPPSVRRLLRRCLEKDRGRRLPDIGAARLEIDDALIPPASDESAANSSRAGEQQRRPVWQAALPWSVAAALGVSLGAVVAMRGPWRSAAGAAPIRVQAETGADASLGNYGAPGADLALSPDGKLFVFAAQGSTGPSHLYVRRLDQLQATALSGTDDARNPFFSPDGQWVGFFTATKLKKVAVTGGSSVTLGDASNGRGGAWGEDGTIAFMPTSVAGAGLFRVSEAGGKPEPLTVLAEGEASQRWPQLLRGGRAVLFTTGTVGTYDEGNIVVQPLPDGPRKVLQRGGYYGRYVPSGHLVYIHGGTLFAAPFSLDRLEVSGASVPVLENVNASTGTAGANFAVADNGTLVYIRGQGNGVDAPVVWMDRSGKTSPLRATAANWSNPRFSPDGGRLAMDVVAGTSPATIWVHDWSRDTSTRLTFGSGQDVRPVWTPDGRRIVYGSSRGGDGRTNLYWQRADGAGDAQRLSSSPNPQIPGSWHPSGKVLAFQERTPNTGLDIMILPLEGDEKVGWKPGAPKALMNSAFDEAEPQFSPDGRWIAYYSTESGQPEVYVRPYPDSSVGRWQISTGGGLYPVWSRTRKELFYSGLNQQLMVTSYAAESDSFRTEKPQPLSATRIVGRPRLAFYDLHPDGERFAVSIPSESSSPGDKVVFVFNFFEELRRLAPAK